MRYLLITLVITLAGCATNPYMEGTSEYYQWNRRQAESTQRALMILNGYNQQTQDRAPAQTRECTYRYANAFSSDIEQVCR